jgi:hypothetical protein
MPGTAGRRYVVVSRRSKIAMSHHATLEAAADKVFRERAFARWKVMAQEGLTASSPMRELTTDEKKRVERKLYPSLFE